MNTSTTKNVAASNEEDFVSDSAQYTITKHNKPSHTNVSKPAGQTSMDKCFNSCLFSIYCKKFLSPCDINHVDSEVIHFIRFLFKEGVGTFFADDNSNPVDNLAFSELGDTIRHFLLAVKNGKNVSDLHLSILFFLKYVLEHSYNESFAQDNILPADARNQLGLDIDDMLPTLNRNNHRIVCIPTIQKLKFDLQRVIEENICLCSENQMLKNKIRLQRKRAACECNKIIQAIINYCEDQLEYCYRCRCDPCCTIPSRLGAGCSTGGCGGYTPSGWNKLMTKARLLCDEKACVCCAPTCTCADCTCGLVRRRPRCRPNLCKDFCNSQTSPQDECGNNNKYRPSLKLLGELAFQLERRILDYVFGMEDSKRRRFYGYTVSNIFSMMEKESKGPKGGSDVITKSELTGRLKKLLTALEKYGYNIKIHGEFAQEMVNKYGLLACPPDESTIDQFGLNDASSIACLIQTLAQGPSEISNFNILLNCLKYLSKCDKRPLFMW